MTSKDVLRELKEAGEAIPRLVEKLTNELQYETLKREMQSREKVEKVVKEVKKEEKKDAKSKKDKS